MSPEAEVALFLQALSTKFKTAIARTETHGKIAYTEEQYAAIEIKWLDQMANHLRTAAEMLLEKQ